MACVAFWKLVFMILKKIYFFLNIFLKGLRLIRRPKKVWYLRIFFSETMKLYSKNFFLFGR